MGSGTCSDKQRGRNSLHRPRTAVLWLMASLLLAFAISPLSAAEDIILIRADTEDESLQDSSAIVRRFGLDQQDLVTIPEYMQGTVRLEVAAIRDLSVSLTDPRTLESLSRNVRLMAVTPGHRVRKSLEMVSGSDLNPIDFSEGASRCLISEDVANEWFGSAESAVGRFFGLRQSQRFLVSGVFRPVNPFPPLTDQPSVLIPLTTFDQRFSQNHLRRAQGAYTLKVIRYSDVEVHLAQNAEQRGVMQQLREYLPRQHPDRKLLVYRLRVPSDD
ncbi:MAG: ABC transporter permease [Planctomycetaceae bacterium]|nr:ABC transporter permease [Planctomycetaceae bacterium]